ncbi:MAG: hypothetical protein KAT28_00685 [Candidatus Aenigmarchaeota archaeon]|nr:hypothetical protein [Candidatus Aenigmarchaeota archaeon]
MEYLGSFNRARTEIKKHFKEISSELYERANHFGLDSNVVDKIKVQLRNSLRRDIGETGTEMQELKIKIIDAVNSSKMEKTEILNLIETCLSSQGNFLDLLNRKLYGKTTNLEKELLHIMSVVDKKLTLGNYNLIRNEIEIHSLFNNSTLEELKGTIMHEFTHNALSVLTPKNIREKRINNDINNTINEEMPEMKQLDDKKSSEEKEKKKMQRMFFNLLLAVDESLAYVAEKYYSKEKEKKPRFNAYYKKTVPELFQKIYNLIDAAANGKSLAEFDYFAAELYSNIVGMWNEDLTETQLKKIMMSVKSKIMDFQKGN